MILEHNNLNHRLWRMGKKLTKALRHDIREDLFRVQIEAKISGKGTSPDHPGQPKGVGGGGGEGVKLP